MARNVIQSEFWTSKMADGSHFDGAMGWGWNAIRYNILDPPPPNQISDIACSQKKPDIWLQKNQLSDITSPKKSNIRYQATPVPPPPPPPPFDPHEAMSECQIKRSEEKSYTGIDTCLSSCTAVRPMLHNQPVHGARRAGGATKSEILVL